MATLLVTPESSPRSMCTAGTSGTSGTVTIGPWRPDPSSISWARAGAAGRKERTARTTAARRRPRLLADDTDRLPVRAPQSHATPVLEAGPWPCDLFGAAGVRARGVGPLRGLQLGDHLHRALGDAQEEPPPPGIDDDDGRGATQRGAGGDLELLAAGDPALPQPLAQQQRGADHQRQRRKPPPEDLAFAHPASLS